MGKLGEALEAGQMSADSRAKIYNNMAHYHNTRGEYQAAITASLQALEASPSLLRPYMRLADSYRLLGNPRMAVLALRKGQAAVLAAGLHWTDFKLEMLKFTAETRSEVERYVRREAGGRAEWVDLRAAMEARFGQKSGRGSREGEDGRKEGAVGIVMARTEEEEEKVPGRTEWMARVSLVVVVVLIVVGLMQISLEAR